MNVCIFCKSDVTRVNNDQFCTVLNSLTDLHAYNRMRFFRIGTNQHDHIYIMCDIVDRVCHSARAKCHSQTGYGCGMTYTGTVIYVVASEAAANHFLNHVNILVRGTGACKSC